MNHPMSSNNTTPVAGEFMTELMWTAHTQWSVTEVVSPTKFFTQPRLIGGCPFEGNPEYSHTPVEFRFTCGMWRSVVKEVVYITEYQNLGYKELNTLPVWMDADETGWRYLKLIVGITPVKTTYNKISLLFGRGDYYWDPSF